MDVFWSLNYDLSISFAYFSFEIWIRRVNFLLNYVFPINILEPRMVFDLWSSFYRSKPFGRIFMKKFLQKIFAVFWNMTWKVEILINDVEEKNFSIVIIVRRYTRQHLIDQNAKQIPINWFSMSNFLYHFRSKICVWSTERFCVDLVLNSFFRKTKVSQQSMSIFI